MVNEEGKREVANRIRETEIKKSREKRRKGERDGKRMSE